MQIRVGPFAGMLLRAAPEYLSASPTAAELCVNCKFQSGDLEPWNLPGPSVASVSSRTKRLLKADDTWFAWDSLNVYAVEPLGNEINGIEQPKVLTTGEDQPKWYKSQAVKGDIDFWSVDQVAAGARDYWADGRVAVKQDSMPKPTWTRSPTEEPTTPVFRAYFYTLVNEFGWESGPSDTSTEETECEDCDEVVVNVPVAPPPNGKIRLYRSVAGNTTAAYALVGEYTTQRITEEVADIRLGQVILPEVEYSDPIPDDLNGLISAHGSFLAGFVGSQIMFSLPGRPHAWPVDYRREIPDEIVALAAVSGNVVILTDGRPYVAQGTNPRNVAMMQLPMFYPCLSADSVVVMGGAVLYATNQGIAAIGSDLVPRIITSDIASYESWNEFIDPSSIRAVQHKGRYVAEGRTPGGSLLASYRRLVSGLPPEGGNLRAFVLDTQYTATSPAITRLDATVLPAGGAMAFDAPTGTAFFSENGSVKQLDSGAGVAQATWLSKKFILPKYERMSLVQVFCGEGTKVRLQRNDEWLPEVNDMREEVPNSQLVLVFDGGEVKRFPSLSKFLEMQLEIQFVTRVKRAYVAETQLDLKTVP